MQIIPYGRQSIDDSDRAAVLEVLNSDWLTQGPAVERFESAVEEFCGNGVKGIAVANATAALHVACLALDLGPGDLLWTSPNTFVASANCGLYCGAEVGFVDIDPVSYNICPEKLEAALVTAQRKGRLPKVVVVVDFAGQSAELEAISRLSKKFGFKILEDASHAVGGTYMGKPIGSCLYSDMAVFSFHPVKIVTTGEGGMIVTRDSELAARAKLFRTHGITRDTARMRGASEGPWYYQQVELGYNYRLTDLQAALGVSQLKRIRSFVDRRRALADIYDEQLAGLPLILPVRGKNGASAWHLYVVQVPASASGAERKRIFERLRGDCVGVNVHYIPVHLQPYYRDLGFSEGQFPVAEAYYQRAISLPLYFGLSEDDQGRVVTSLKSALN